MPVLMEHVASRARVSVTTVSHVLNDTRPVAPLTRERVLEAIRELNYYQNASARLLARGHSDSFGLIISDIENPFFPELIKSFELACLERRMDILLCTTNYDAVQARKAVRRMIESKVRAVAVMTSQLEAALVDELTDSGVPVVLLDGAEVRRSRSSVKVDYSQGSLEAVSHLRALGHRDPAIVTGPLDRVSAATYRESLVDAMARQSLPAPRVIEGNNKPDCGARAVRQLLGQPRFPTAILCGNDLAAIGAMGAVFEAGLRVPEDVSIMGADDISFASFSHPPLTTIRIPRDSLGHMAFEILEKMLRSKKHTGVEYVLETRLVIRQSTGLCPTPKKSK